MRSGRLLVNSEKIKVRIFATYQKQSKVNLYFHLDIKGNEIKDLKYANLLGVTLSNDISWTKHTDEVLAECRKKLNGLYKVKR